ncbi:MAG: TonB family protein [Xanthobacteraceae bacterium]
MSMIITNTSKTLTAPLYDTLLHARPPPSKFAPGAVRAASAAGIIALSVVAVLAQQTPPPQPAPPPAAAAPASPSPAPPAAPSPAIASWQQSLVAHLARFERYPAQARGAQGVVTVAFRIDRQGNVVSSRIAKTSGSAVLDADALAMIKRAAPLPPPPAGIVDDDLSIVVPIRYATGEKS